MIKKNLIRPSALVLAGALLSVGLIGCDEKKAAPAPAAAAPALPLTSGPATATTPAPAAAALPAAPRVRVVHVTNPADRYAYVDRAYEMSRAIGDAPPDYDFDYRGVHAWVWRSSNREVRVIEPVQGGYRYNYYRPGSSGPYLVRDPDYSYGFSDGQLVAVYDNEGRLLSPEYIDRRADDAGRYLARATALYEASLRNERRSVNAANWAARRAELDAEHTRWQEQQNQQEAWRAYHAQHEAEDHSYWQAERDQRERSARSFNDWQRRGYDGPPPAPVRYDGQNGRNGPSGFQRGDAPRDGGQMRSPPGRDSNAAQQAEAAKQAKAVADAAAQARKQQAEADAAAQARQRQAEAEDHARQVTQADAAKAKADSERQAQAKAAADKHLQAQAEFQARQKAKIEEQAQRKAQAAAKADAAQQARAKADADSAARLQQQKSESEARRQARAKAADAEDHLQQQKAEAEAVRHAKAKAAHEAAEAAKDAEDAKREAAKKAHDGKPPQNQP